MSSARDDLELAVVVIEAEGLADAERRNEALIVDDNPLNLKLVRVLLGGEGYTVHMAVDAEQALNVLDQLTPDVILMDVELPGMDGLELTRRIKADPARRNITILALTAYAMKGDDERARAAGADGYLVKPVDTRALPDVISRLHRQTIARMIQRTLTPRETARRGQ